MTEHTPGPWESNGMVIEADVQEICLMGHPAQYAGDVGLMFPNYVANAALIARAPELLAENEALKARIAELEEDNASMEEHLEELQKENDGLMSQVEELELTLSGGK